MNSPLHEPIDHKTRLVLAITGASGSIYAETLLRICLQQKVKTYLIFSPAAQKVIRTEIPGSFLDVLMGSEVKMRLDSVKKITDEAIKRDIDPESLSVLKIFDHDDLYAPVASGSLGATHMCVLPSSMGTVARIAHGMSGNLIERCADVMLKERRPLIVVPRETPLSLIHLRNLTQLAEAGAKIVPAMPAFYHNPRTLEDAVTFMVERVAQALEISALASQNVVQWNARRL